MKAYETNSFLTLWQRLEEVGDAGITIHQRLFEKEKHAEFSTRRPFRQLVNQQGELLQESVEEIEVSRRVANGIFVLKKATDEVMRITEEVARRYDRIRGGTGENWQEFTEADLFGEGESGFIRIDPGKVNLHRILDPSGQREYIFYLPKKELITPVIS